MGAIRVKQNLRVGVWGLVNDREHLAGDSSAFGVGIDYPNDLVDLSLSSTRIGTGFDPSVSFVSRSGVHIWELSALFNPRPAWPGVREITQETVDTVLGGGALGGEAPRERASLRHNLARALDDRWRFVSNQLPVKVQ